MKSFFGPGVYLRVRPRLVRNTRLQWVLKSLVVVSGTFVAGGVLAQDVQFNSDFLPEDSRSLDLAAYQKGNPVLAGQYRADVIVNGKVVTRQDIQIRADKDGSNPTVCFSRGFLELLGVDISKLSPESAQRLESGEQCLALPDLVEGATATFSPSTQQLDISIAQVAMRRSARGYVSPELWDSGVTAGILSYNFNTSSLKTPTGNQNTAYLGLNTGLNIGEWRLRHDGTLNWQQQRGASYQRIATYAQRDITSLKSQLTVGEANTSGEIFDTLSFTGVQLATDDRMLPETLRGYAPVVRGIARTNARVAIRQNGNLLFETTVAPGAFVIDDLYATGYGGDLSVTVYEADGTQQSFIVPYASVTQLLRPGTSRFSTVIGQTRSAFNTPQRPVVQGTYQRGLNNTFTGYGGMQSSDNYLNVLVGSAFGTPMGALAVDISQAQTQLKAGASQGQSVRLSYSKNILSTGSNFSVGAYRFSSSGYLDFASAMQLLDAEQAGLDSSTLSRPRSRLSLTADQRVGEHGRLWFSGFTQNYWNQAGTDVQYQLGYNTQVGKVTYGVSANRTRIGVGDMQNSVSLSVSMPLDFGAKSGFSPQLQLRMDRTPDGKYNESATYSDVAGTDREYNYSATATHDGAGRTNSTAVSGQYIGSKSTLGASLSHGDGYDSVLLSASGSVVAHPNGVTFTSARGDTMAVVSAPGAEGAKVVGYPGLKLDSQGNAVVPYLRPYELNEVAIDPIGTSLNVELEETSQQVAPRSGAVVLLKYGTNTGQAVLVNVTAGEGVSLPFGAGVVDESGSSVGTVGQGGQLYARVKEGTRRLLVKWGEHPDQQCSLELPAIKNDGQQLQQLEATCSAAKKNAAQETER